MKSIILYIILVGLPLAGLFAILEGGASLEPPPAIGGVWAIERDDTQGCADLDAIEIEQSGRYLRVRANGKRFAKGRFDAHRVTTRVPIATSSCGDDAISIDAVLHGADELVGWIAPDPCHACARTPFVARRRPRGPS